MERYYLKKIKGPYITGNILNLLDTVLVLGFAFIFLINYFSIQHQGVMDGFKYILASTLAFYICDIVFHLFTRAPQNGMLLHHFISIVGLLWMISHPEMYLESAILMLFALSTFQHPINSIMKILRWKNSLFLKHNAIWNWNLFLFSRGFAVPVVSLYGILNHEMPIYAVVFLILLNIWGWAFIPIVRKSCSPYMKTNHEIKEDGHVGENNKYANS